MKVLACWRRGAYKSRDARGQAMVEFGLVLPLLLVFLLGVVDFGRVFSDGITMEAAARNAAEAAAQEYQQVLRNTPTPGSSDYQRIHDVALDELCREAKVLSNVAVNGVGKCTMPVTAVCIHDQFGGDNLCGHAGSAVPPECASIDRWAASADPSDVAPVPVGQTPLAYVEVRTCYQFTTLFNLNIQLPLSWAISLGNVWIQRERHFVVGNY